MSNFIKAELATRYDATDEEITELCRRLGPLDHQSMAAIVQTLIVMRIAELTKRIERLENIV